MLPWFLSIGLTVYPQPGVLVSLQPSSMRLIDDTLLLTPSHMAASVNRSGIALYGYITHLGPRKRASAFTMGPFAHVSMLMMTGFYLRLQSNSATDMAFVRGTPDCSRHLAAPSTVKSRVFGHSTAAVPATVSAASETTPLWALIPGHGKNSQECSPSIWYRRCYQA